jgi:hypothetical protein
LELEHGGVGLPRRGLVEDLEAELVAGPVRRRDLPKRRFLKNGVRARVCALERKGESKREQERERERESTRARDATRRGFERPLARARSFFCTLMKASISPTAGMKSGMKHLRVVSSST